MLSLLPPLVSFIIGGNEQVVTLFLTIFSVAVGVGSGLRRLARRRAHRAAADRRRHRAARPVLARSRLDRVRGGAGRKPAGHRRLFRRAAFSIHIAVDLAGLAIAGGLFIVPVFTAIQVWAGTDRRARVVAAVNVLNAAFMVVGALVLARAAEARASARRCCSR